MKRLVPIHNPYPGGTYIWVTVDGAPAAEPECGTEAPEPEPEAEP